MREIDFLPTWYPKVRRQRTLLTIQAWTTAVLVSAGLLALAVTQRKAEAAKLELEQTKIQTRKTLSDVKQLEEMQRLEQQLVAKRKIVSEVGLPVELGRVVTELAACLPREVTFTEVLLATRESRPESIADRAAGKETVRKLELRLKGIAPTEAEVTSFWLNLNARPFMEQVRMVSSNESRAGDHLMREFEVTLTIPLNVRGGGK